MLSYDEHAAKVRVKLGKTLARNDAASVELNRVDYEIRQLEKHRKRLLRRKRDLGDRWSQLMTELLTDP